MNVHIIRVDGSEERLDIPFAEIAKAIGAEAMDGFSLRDGRYVLCDDTALIDGKLLNDKATALYHGICRPGVTHYIAGDVAIIVDAECP